MRLHLGCGKRRFDGFINIDLHDSDLDCDIRFLPFDPNSADEIIAIHVAEHFYVREILKILRGWYEILKPGGTMVLELPCLDKVLEHFKKGSPENFTLWALYGDPNTHKDGEPALHKWCWSKDQMRQLLKAVGFDDVIEEVPQFHQPSRDMRWVCIK